MRKIVQLPLENIVFFDRKRTEESIENIALGWFISFINFFSHYVKEISRQSYSVCGGVNKCLIE